MSEFALEARGLGKRYGKKWALRDCTLEIPTGCVAALVGPNGAGKTTLLHLAVGLTDATAGSVRVLGRSAREKPEVVLPRLGFVAQEHPLYRRFRIGEMLKAGEKLNATWDQALAQTRLERLGIPLDQKIGTLSGGQQAQVALTLALAKRPELLVLDGQQRLTSLLYALVAPDLPLKDSRLRRWFFVNLDLLLIDPGRLRS